MAEALDMMRSKIELWKKPKVVQRARKSTSINIDSCIAR